MLLTPAATIKCIVLLALVIMDGLHAFCLSFIPSQFMEEFLQPWFR
jgi:hypothetical protein